MTNHAKLSALGSLAFLAGCAGGLPGAPADTDGDGLTDEFEDSIGLDIEDQDTDGDGFTDAEEHLNFYFADDASDYPRTGDYPRHARPRSLEVEGSDIGNVVASWNRTDQFGDEITLHEFYGNVILVGIGADW
jgi:hypothetical protein